MLLTAMILNSDSYPSKDGLLRHFNLESSWDRRLVLAQEKLSHNQVHVQRVFVGTRLQVPC